MKKPSVFVSKIDHKLNNNERVFSSFEERKYVDESIDVRKKLNDIFSSPKYVYKADVVIKTKDDIMEKTIVGMNKEEILTFDNKKIKIRDIIDINLKK